MKTRITSSLPNIIAGMQVTTLVCLGAVVVPAHADSSMTSAESPSRVESTNATGVSATGNTGISAAPRGNEMSVLAGVELERTDRRFRSRVVDWARDRSVAAGFATDFLLHGSDTGVHLRLQSRSEYVVRWETRF